MELAESFRRDALGNADFAPPAAAGASRTKGKPMIGQIIGYREFVDGTRRPIYLDAKGHPRAER
jgi:hypothetical protein